MKRLFALCLFLLAVLPFQAAHADDAVPAQLTLLNHAFAPAELTVPAGRKIKLTVVNKEATAAEFESDDLDREKVVPANGRIDVYIGPLDAGTYGYFDDFHHGTTGKIVAK